MQKLETMKYEFYKNDPTDVIWWVDDTEYIGRRLFSFDRRTVYNLFEDYPDKLTKRQKIIFNKENPELAEMLAGRQ